MGIQSSDCQVRQHSAGRTSALSTATDISSGARPQGRAPWIPQMNRTHFILATACILSAVSAVARAQPQPAAPLKALEIAFRVDPGPTYGGVR